MTTLFVILIILASVVLGLIVLVQNPKGGGLAGNIAGFSNQFMGVKQTTDVLEKAPGSLVVLSPCYACFLCFLFLNLPVRGQTEQKMPPALQFLLPLPLSKMLRVPCN